MIYFLNQNNINLVLKKLINMSKSARYEVCIVKNCDLINSETPRVFHTLPTNPERKKEWLDAVGVTDVNYKSRVCELHFESNDYALCNLKRSAIPWKNLHLSLPKINLNLSDKFVSYEYDENNNIGEHQFLFSFNSLIFTVDKNLNS